jgi:molecular chaperone DnaJ
MTKNFYELLGVEKSASPEDIKKAFKKGAIKYHPDKASDENKVAYEEKFKEINEAYSVLSDPDKRHQYDTFGTYDHSAPMNTNMHDILNELFGGAGGGGHPMEFFHGGMPMGGGSGFQMFFGNARGDPSGGSKHFSNGLKQDVIDINITLTELYHGVNKNITYDILDKCDACNGIGAKDPSDIIKCMTCQGRGSIPHSMGPFMVQQSCGSCGGKGTIIKQNRECSKCQTKGITYYSRSFSLKIPQGVPNQHIYKMEGKGSYDKHNNTYNDIIIVFHHVVEPNFKIDYSNNNVLMDINITLEELFCGFTRKINIYGGELTIYSDRYFDPSKPKHVKNKGIPYFKKKEGGDLVIKFNVHYPEDEQLRKYHKIFLTMFKKEQLTIPTNSININHHE